MWTEDQSKCIYSRGKDLIVSASAGSGKTSVMIERIVQLLKEGVDLKETAVCTFTVSAASDMKAKLARRLKDEGGMTTHLAYLPQADISTLHSFCQKIIRTYFYAADVDPTFEIADETMAEVMLGEAVEAVIEQEIQKGSENFNRLYNVMLSGRKHTRLAARLHELYRFAAVQPSPKEWMNSCLLYTLRHDECLKRIEEIVKGKRAALFSRADDLYIRMLQAKLAPQETECAANLMQAISGNAQLIVMPRVKLEAQYLDLHEELKNLRAEFRSAEKKHAIMLLSANAKDTVPFAEVLLNMTKNVIKEYSEAKNRRSLCDFNDLEHLTLQILNSSAGGLVRARYKYLFVDEYQDINPLQENILQSLGGQGFFVGDIKQSIYAFRMCSPQIFAERYQAYCLGLGEGLQLNSNFRSDSEILEFCNEVFSPIMTHDFGSVEYSRDARLISAKGKLYSPSVNAFIIKTEKREKPKAEGVYSVMNRSQSLCRDASTAQAALIAEHVSELLGKSVTENGKQRAVTTDDITILVRSRSKLVVELAKIFNKLSLPFSITDKQDADEIPAIAPLLNFLRLIDNSADDVALAAVALQFFDFSEDKLSSIRIAADKGLFFHEAFAAAAKNEASKIDSELSKKAAAMLEQVAFYRGLKENACSVAGRLAADFNMFLTAQAELGGGDALADFLDGVAACPQGASVSEYIAFINKKMPRLAAGGKDGGIKISTIHASKGLEYNFVILADMQRRFDFKDVSSEMILSDKYGLCLKNYDYEAGTVQPTAQYILAAEEKRKKQLEEEMRVLYVALTRARLSLSIFGLQSGDRENTPKSAFDAVCFLDWLAPHLKAKYFTAEECVFRDDAPVITPIFTAPDEQLKSLIEKRINFVYPFDGYKLKTTVTAMSAAEQIDYQALREEAQFANTADEVYVSADEGSAYHLYMQTADITIDFTADYTRFSKLYPQSAAYVKKEIACKAFEFLQSIAKEKSVFREQPFVFKTEQGTLVQGIIDLLLVRGNEAEIVDYKTVPHVRLDRPSYRKQVEIYALAAEKLLGVKVVRKCIYSILDDKTLEL